MLILGYVDLLFESQGTQAHLDLLVRKLRNQKFRCVTHIWLKHPRMEILSVPLHLKYQIWYGYIVNLCVRASEQISNTWLKSILDLGNLMKLESDL